MKRILFTLSLLPFAISSLLAQDDNTERLWYNQPASIWLEALPIGNSRLGGMVYGGTNVAQLQLNEETFWSGGPHNNNSKTSINYLDQVRQLIFNGKESDAESLINQQFVKGPHGMRYLSLGSLKFTFTGYKATSVTDYYRELDLQTAVTKETFTVDSTHYTRTAFASLADSIIVYRIESDGDSLTFNITHECDFTSAYSGKTNNVKITISGVAQEGISAALKAE